MARVMVLVEGEYACSGGTTNFARSCVDGCRQSSAWFGRIYEPKANRGTSGLSANIRVERDVSAARVHFELCANYRSPSRPGRMRHPGARDVRVPGRREMSRMLHR